MSQKYLLSDFSATDSAGCPRDFTAYLERISRLPQIQAYKKQVFSLLDLLPGQQILDIGCGLGADLCTLAQSVAPHGCAVGVDSSEAAIRQARCQAAASGLPVQFLNADIHQLPLEENRFHASRADRVFMHLAQPRQALAQMVRVTRPGGRILITEPDWETLIVDSSAPALTRQILNLRSDMLPNGWIGRQLRRLFMEAGLTDLHLSGALIAMTEWETAEQIAGLSAAAKAALDKGLITAGEADTWVRELCEADACGHFFASITFMTVAATKPL